MLVDAGRDCGIFRCMRYHAGLACTGLVMHKLLLIIALLVASAAFIYSDRLGQEEPDDVVERADSRPATLPDRAVLDISVHTLEELRVLFDRAEALAQQQPDVDASVVLVLHGPEVEFFSTRTYDMYRDIVDQAARLDSLDVVDIRICQSMMAARGIARDDIPPFIEQVPDGRVEVERLADEGYVYF